MCEIDKVYEEKMNDQFFEEDIVKSIEETFSIHHRSKEELIKILENLVEEYKEDVMYDKYEYDEYVLFSKNKQLSIYIEDIDTVPMVFTKNLNQAMLISDKSVMYDIEKNLPQFEFLPIERDEQNPSIIRLIKQKEKQ